MQIKLYSEDYTQSLLEIYSYYVYQSAFTFDLVAPVQSEFHQKLKTSHACLVGLVEDKVVGFVYASSHRAKAAYDTVCETTIYMDANHHGAGHGTKLYGTLLKLIKALGYYTALGGVTVPNPASEGLHKKLGFEPSIRYERIGYKDGEWRNVIWWRKDLLPFDSAPEPPLSIEAIAPSDLELLLV